MAHLVSALLNPLWKRPISVMAAYRACDRADRFLSNNKVLYPQMFKSEHYQDDEIIKVVSIAAQALTTITPFQPILIIGNVPLLYDENLYRSQMIKTADLEEALFYANSKFKRSKVVIYADNNTIADIMQLHQCASIVTKELYLDNVGAASYFPEIPQNYDCVDSSSFYDETLILDYVQQSRYRWQKFERRHNALGFSLQLPTFESPLSVQKSMIL